MGYGLYLPTGIHRKVGSGDQKVSIDLGDGYPVGFGCRFADDWDGGLMFETGNEATMNKPWD